jgi:hypothetical protein
LEYFALIGGAPVEFNVIESTHTIALHCVPERFEEIREAFFPAYVLQKPYREMLIAVARGDGRRYAAMRKARIGERAGERIEEELLGTGILICETSRESPLRLYPKQKIKKALRHYRIQDKLRFAKPFYRFWFGFVEPFASELQRGDTQRYAHYFQEHYERLQSLVFEQLSNAFLYDYFAERGDAIVSGGSFWDKDSEFDILAVTQSGKVILGECKYRGRPVCKSELGKLQNKALRSNIRADVFALFSGSGFSNELRAMRDDRVLLFDAEAMERLCQEGR